MRDRVGDDGVGDDVSAGSHGRAQRITVACF